MIIVISRTKAPSNCGREFSKMATSQAKAIISDKMLLNIVGISVTENFREKANIVS